MPRPPRPWYRKGRGWHATIMGRKVPLGVTAPGDEGAAVAALRKLLNSLENKPVSRETVADAVGRFLDRQAARGLAPDTVRWYSKHLARLAALYGTRLIDDLDPDAVAADCHRQRTWGPDTRRNYLCAVETMLKFAGRSVRFEKPPRGSAGAKAVIPESVYHMAVGAARGDLRGLLVVLWNTGARPKEIRLLEAEQVDWSAGVASLEKHKTARRTGKPRLVVFPPAAMEVLEKQRAKHQTGLLFRTSTGTAYTCPGLTQEVWRLAARIGKPLTSYGCRHAFATDAIAKGVPMAHVAALLGHTSTAMLERTYNHISSRAELLKDAAARVRPAG